MSPSRPSATTASLPEVLQSLLCALAHALDALLGALVISIVSIVLNTLTGTGRTRIKVRHSRRPPDRDDDGPVIDV